MMKNIMNVLKVLLTIKVTILVTACGLGGSSVPADHYFRVPEIILTAQAKPSFSLLTLKPVKASGLYHERAILYIEKDKPLEVQRYHYNFWSDTPAELIHNALFQGLNSAAISSQLNRGLSEERADFIIDCRIVHFERLIDKHQANVRVVLDISVKSGQSSNGKRITKRYASDQSVDSMSMHDSAVAFGKALREISLHLSRDLVANN